MSFSKKEKDEILEFILDSVREHPKDLIQYVVDEKSITRQTVSNYIKELSCYIKKESKKGYTLLPVKDESFAIQIISETGKKVSEDSIYVKYFKKYFIDLKPNVSAAVDYCFLELMNNIIDHSNSRKAWIRIILTGSDITFFLKDTGDGIFDKIQKHGNFESLKEAAFQLTVGGYTTAREMNHAGQGVFFSSQIADEFKICSNGIIFSADNGQVQEISEEHRKIKGTIVKFRINIRRERTVDEIFRLYQTDYDFDKTIIHLHLLERTDIGLTARSQARRIIGLIQGCNFKEVTLDFENVEHIEQGFAFSLFGALKTETFNAAIKCINMNEKVLGLKAAAERNIGLR